MGLRMIDTDCMPRPGCRHGNSRFRGCPDQGLYADQIASLLDVRPGITLSPKKSCYKTPLNGIGGWGCVRYSAEQMSEWLGYKVYDSPPPGVKCGRYTAGSKFYPEHQHYYAVISENPPDRPNPPAVRPPTRESLTKEKDGPLRVAEWASAAGLSIARSNAGRTIDRLISMDVGRSRFADSDFLDGRKSPAMSPGLILPDRSPGLDSLPVIPKE